MAQIAITIDTEFPDHPARDPIATCEELLEILRANRIPATFFIVGSWARAYPTLVQRIARDEHLIGAHGYSHCNLEKLTDAGIVDDLTECHDQSSPRGPRPGRGSAPPTGRSAVPTIASPMRSLPPGIATSTGTPAAATGIPRSPPRTSPRGRWPRSMPTGRPRSCSFIRGPIARRGRSASSSTG